MEAEVWVLVMNAQFIVGVYTDPELAKAAVNKPSLVWKDHHNGNYTAYEPANGEQMRTNAVGATYLIWGVQLNHTETGERIKQMWMNA